jgi:amino acid transporter
MHATPPASPAPSGLKNAARVIIVGSIMFSFISYWRTAAVVLCDLGSTAYYIGGIVESAIGAAAPWFILAVMLFSYAVRSVYIESCALFTRGGVYRVVKEAMGGGIAKLAVSALIFDYLLTGPISGVSAGQYLVGLILETLGLINDQWIFPDALKANIKAWGSVALCLAIIVYFFWLNIKGIHESSDRALKIMIATTIMVVVIIGWSLATLALNGIARYEVRDEHFNVVKNDDGTPMMRRNELPMLPNLTPQKKWNAEKNEYEEQDDALGFLANTRFAEHVRPPENVNWWSLFGLAGLIIAFGHSILAMSGEETLAQVYRDVESPKLPNFRRAALIVFIYSLVFTAGISFLAILLIPQDQRVNTYSENLISGLAMNMIGHPWARIGLNIFVVFVGFLILAGAVNTAIIGSNGVLNRVAEDGILPQWFLKPHPKYGTTYRLLYLIVGLMIAITLYSQGDVILLGEAYAFGVVWSFVFKAMCMVVLRFKDHRPREYKVPFNLKLGSVEIPFGLLSICLVLMCAAAFNLMTKEKATIGGVSFTIAFFLLFWITEHLQHRRHGAAGHKHLEQFNQERDATISMEGLGLKRPYRKLVAIRSTQNLVMLEKALHDTDPNNTDVIVMTAKMVQGEGDPASSLNGDLDPYDQELMTAVVDRAEHVGKPVHPLIIPTNRPLYALVKTASDLKVHELIVGASNVLTADEQIEQIGFYWFNLHQGEPAPLTVRILGREREVQFDLGGGNRIPKAGEIQARDVAELRAAGVGVHHVLAVVSDSPEGLDIFQMILTALDPAVPLTVATVGDHGYQAKMEEQAEQVGRQITFANLAIANAESILERARSEKTDLIIAGIGEPQTREDGLMLPKWAAEVVRRSPCRVALTALPGVPTEVMDRGPAATASS